MNSHGVSVRRGARLALTTTAERAAHGSRFLHRNPATLCPNEPDEYDAVRYVPQTCKLEDSA